MRVTHHWQCLPRDLARFEAAGWTDSGKRVWVESCREYVCLLDWEGEGEPPTVEATL